MPSFRYRDEDTTIGHVLSGAALGGLAGFAVGVILAQKVGGISGLTARVRARFRDLGEELALSEEELEAAYAEDELEAESADAVLEERVLDAFRRDPVLSERAVDIGAVGDATIELSGWVNTEDESERAVEVARNAPGVANVVNRLEVGDRERVREQTAERFEQGDDSLTEARWEGQRVGTGRRRQGTSAESDRHADPKVDLGERWLDKRKAMREAADDPDGIVEGVTEDLPAERLEAAKRPPKGGRKSGSRSTPSGVPKGDHVADPEQQS
jgi:hypothetical protein